MNVAIKAGQEAARLDVQSGIVNEENFDDASYDAEVNVRQAEAHGDRESSDFWFAYGSTLDSFFI